MLLAGDLGGTKTNLAIYTPEMGPRTPVVEATFRSTDYASLEAMVSEFIQGTGVRVEQACLGVAGPVVGGYATITNLPWVIDEGHLAQQLKLKRMTLLNDLVAVAYAVPTLGTNDLHVINRGKAIAQGPLAVIAPGTGLGEAYLVHDGQGYRAYPSEGGHADFAPSNEIELGLLAYLRKQHGHVSYERVCSGKYLPNLYNYLKDSHVAQEPAWLATELAASKDHTPIILGNALDPDKKCALCTATLNLFVSILGAEAGNLALKVLATGGVYLGGGIPPRILSKLDCGLFMNAFQNKGRFTELLSHIPVQVILNPKAALLGAASFGLGQL